MNRFILIAVLLALFATTTSESQDTESAAIMSGTIMEAMVVTITPASDIIWGVEDPQTDEEWQVLDDAAVTAYGGLRTRRARVVAVPNDDAWASRGRSSRSTSTRKWSRSSKPGAHRDRG